MVTMAGHSHWAGIRHKKGAADKKRGKLFSKLARRIITAAKQGGGDIDTNLQLKYAVDAAKAANMPKDNISRAIKKGTGELPGAVYEELVYEGYGPGGVALQLEILTDNRNRITAEIRHIFDRRGAKLGETGCVGWMFDKKGLFTVDAGVVDEDTLMDAVIEAGADNVDLQSGVYEVTTEVGAFAGVRAALEEKGIETQMAQLANIPQSTVRIADIETARKLLALLEALEDNEDVQNVYANFDIPDEILETVEAEAG
jgi:YebC/PmpR family DNA-binding regulatory protein